MSQVKKEKESFMRLRPAEFCQTFVASEGLSISSRRLSSISGVNVVQLFTSSQHNKLERLPLTNKFVPRLFLRVNS
jgi:hypothetical protein